MVAELLSGIGFRGDVARRFIGNRLHGFARHRGREQTAEVVVGEAFFFAFKVVLSLGQIALWVIPGQFQVLYTGC
ncbi:hypothetical protein D3C87_1970710 [compost metagenome]